MLKRFYRTRPWMHKKHNFSFNNLLYRAKSMLSAERTHFYAFQYWYLNVSFEVHTSSLGPQKVTLDRNLMKACGREKEWRGNFLIRRGVKKLAKNVERRSIRTRRPIFQHKSRSMKIYEEVFYWFFPSLQHRSNEISLIFWLMLGCCVLTFF